MLRGYGPPLVCSRKQACNPQECRLLAGQILTCILDVNSEAMNPGARCRAVHPSLEGRKSRNRLAGDLVGCLFSPAVTVVEIQASESYLPIRMQWPISLYER